MFDEQIHVRFRIENLRREAEQERLLAEARRARREAAGQEDGGRVSRKRAGRSQEEASGSPPGRAPAGLRRVLRWGTGA